MKIEVIILFIICFLELIWGVYFILTNFRSQVRRIYSFFIFSVFLWGMSNALFIVINDLERAIFWGKLTYLAAISIAVFFLYFSWLFPYKNTEVKKIKKFILILPVIIVFILLYFTHSLVKGQVFRFGINDLVLGKAYYLFVVFFAGYMIWGIINLFKKYFISDGIHRWQLKYLLWGVIVSSALGMTFNLILPLFGITRYGLYGPISSIAWLGATGYIVWRR